MESCPPSTDIPQICNSPSQATAICNSPSQATANWYSQERSVGELLNRIFERETIYEEIRNILTDFERKCKQPNYKKGIYLYGAPGAGKTSFVNSLLRSLNYDIVSYDAGDVRNKVLIESIASSNMSNRNVMSMMERKTKKIAIVMDEIDGMNGGDKGGINALIKLIRQKRTKKQKMEFETNIPIICIGNYHIDKKIKELMKVCHVFEIKSPTLAQIETILSFSLPCNTTLKPKMLQYIQGDLRKLDFMIQIFHNYSPEQAEDSLDNIFLAKTHDTDSKHTVHLLFQSPALIHQHEQYVTDTERTIVSLLFHENVLDILQSVEERNIKIWDGKKSKGVYFEILQNICFADFIERVTFQSQVWAFNEMSFLVKTFYNNYLLHEHFPNCPSYCPPVENMRFTKILTKYSTEYNNQIFICKLCQELKMDKKDLFSFFTHLRKLHGAHFTDENELFNRVFDLFQSTNITKLDIKRMYRFLDRNSKNDTYLNELDEEYIIENEIDPWKTIEIDT
jgi:DNA polymerase III delta prime subunit